ncbi:hypothetical protein GIB67_019682 [Kingdonia uniflora]|uniref:Thioredoxin domain-containing protein n=1 Tax=Kingdonia uniflora TaxID=39325 RepID=A0A7J7MJU7_9MAGN|nr:hypothetical protein GIB67_019682 [Kingdonia uniflora]
MVDGESLDGALRSCPSDVYAALLFYASWCPFSRDARSTFDMLSTMFPRIRHMAIEQSSAMPSVFSRYGVRSLPSILLVNQNQTAKIRYHVRYHGPKDHESLVRFYKKITGHEPVVYLADNQPSSLGISEKSALLQLLGGGSSMKEILRRETYLVFSILFLCLRSIIYFCPGMLSHIRAVWVHYIPHLNLGIFGETSQLLGRVRHVIDVKRLWSKTRNLQKGAKNARVWASSLASVSLDQSSSTRSGSS